MICMKKRKQSRSKRYSRKTESLTNMPSDDELEKIGKKIDGEMGELLKKAIDTLSVDEAKLKQRKVRDVRNAAIKGGYYKDVRSVIPEDTKRILLICPPKLLEDFQQLCDQESYALVEGIREAMRQFIWAHRPEDYESPEEQEQGIQRYISALQDMAKMQQYPSTLSSQGNTL